MNVIKREAVNRMVELNLSRLCLNAFIDHDTPWLSENHGMLYELDDEQTKIVHDFEQKHNALVYHVIHDFTQFGELYSLLFVSNDKSEWNYERPQQDKSTIFSYVVNVTYPECSEFGSINIRPRFGGVERF